jgi:hypothetical protein
MKEKDDRTAGFAERAVNIVTSSTAANAAAGATTTALAVFWAMFPAAVAMCIWAGFEWRKARAQRWWARLVECSCGQTAEELQGLIEANREQPWVRETILDSVRRLLEVSCDETVDVLGSLTAEYLRNKRPPDPFFRGIARVLSDLSAEELADLRELVRDIVSVSQPRFTIEQILIGGEKRLRIFFVSEPADELGSTVARAQQTEKYQEFKSPSSYLCLCNLLKVNGLGQESVSGYIGARGGPNVIVGDLDTFARFAEHLGVPSR